MGKTCRDKYLIVGTILGYLLTSCSMTGPKVPPEHGSLSRNGIPSSVTHISVTHAPEVQNQARLINTLGSELTLERIMADPDWMGRSPESAHWALDSLGVIYQQKRVGTQLRQTIHRPLNSNNNGTHVPLAELHKYAHQDKVWDQTRTRAAWANQGSLFLYEKGEVVQLFQDQRPISHIKFLNNNRLSYLASQGIFSIDLSTRQISLLVSWEFASQPSVPPAPSDYVSMQQQALIQSLQVNRQQRRIHFEHQQSLTRANPTLDTHTFYFPDDHELVDVSVSYSGKWLILVEQASIEWQNDSDVIPNYITEDGRVSTSVVRRRVGDEPSRNHYIWLVDIQNNTKQKLSYATLPGFTEDVLQNEKRENAELTQQSYQPNRLPRNIVLLDDWSWSQSAIQWHPKFDTAAIMLEAWDNKDRWLTSIDPKSARLDVEHRLHDDAWINYRFNSFGWLNHTETLYFLSEESGYAHLYLKSTQSNAQPMAMTQGHYEVNNLTLVQDDSRIYFTANQSHPGIYEVYSVDLETGGISTHTNMQGKTAYVLSPDEQSLLLTYSGLTAPPELYYQHVNSAKAIKLTDTTTSVFEGVNWLSPDIVAFDSTHHDRQIFARLYAPDAANSNGKAVVFNHGAGYLQNAHYGWSGYFREYMFHNLLVQKGYTVLDIDYQGSAGYGRDWRTAIYRNMGSPELDDIADGVNYLISTRGIDPKGVGTYGGSYGGFLTFMALFKAPDLFAAGAALRPVSDWAYYNHGYTSNILNTPQLDPIAYERSSPIYFAQGLQVPLLISAPMVDSNVFFLDVVRLTQRLIELEKDNFEVAIYPMESHGFVHPSAWLDQYKRILKLFETHL